MNRKPAIGGRKPGAFTLIEVVIAMSLIALLVGGIYAVAQGAFRVSNEVVRAQQRSMLVHSFVELCRRNFEAMPGNGQVELVSEGGAGQFLTQLIFTDYPMAFTWSGVAAGSAEVIMLTEPESRGSLRVKLQYLDPEEAEKRRAALAPGDLGTSLELLSGVRVLQWRFYDPRTEEWETEWVDASRRPTLVELNLEFYDASDPVRAVFWIPTVANPEQVVQGAQAGAAAGAPGAGAETGLDQGGGPAALPTDPEARRAALERLRQQRGGGGGGNQRGEGNQRPRRSR
ncbi:hypothetical protein BH23VER1_BH23VER1_32250 [soil metagenome]